MSDRFKRIYAVEIEFDTPFDFAEQDRLACVVIENLVADHWDIGRAHTMQANEPVKVVAYPIGHGRSERKTEHVTSAIPGEPK